MTQLPNSNDRGNFYAGSHSFSDSNGIEGHEPFDDNFCIDGHTVYGNKYLRDSKSFDGNNFCAIDDSTYDDDNIDDASGDSVGIFDVLIFRYQLLNLVELNLPNNSGYFDCFVSGQLRCLIHQNFVASATRFFQMLRLFPIPDKWAIIKH